MKEELEELRNLGTFVIRKRDSSKPVLRAVWIFKIKSDGRLKSRLAVDGSDQVLSFMEIHATVGSRSALRCFLVFAVVNQLEVKKFPTLLVLKHNFETGKL